MLGWSQRGGIIAAEEAAVGYPLGDAVRVATEVEFNHDESANAAVITFDPRAKGRQLRTLTVNDGDDIAATLSFDQAGALVQIELLDASRQIPVSLHPRRDP